MRIAIAVNENHPNYNIFLAFLTRFISSELGLKIDIIPYRDINSLHSHINKKCDYVLIMHRYCYIDFKKLEAWLIKNKPDVAGLSIDKELRVGYPFFMLIKSNLFKPMDELYSFSSRDTIENYFLNTVHRVSQKKQSNIVTLDSICYLANCNYTNSFFHKSVFITLSDMDKNFATTMNMLSSGIKEVYYDNKLYKLKLGKSFFIYKYWNFAILPNRTVLVWNNIKNKWTVATKTQNKILQQIL